MPQVHPGRRHDLAPLPSRADGGGDRLTSTDLAGRPILATHGGSFHLDDCFAYVVLRLALGLRAAGPEGDHRLLRTRDAAAIEGADLVWDVGAIHDPAAGRYDHHQRGAPVREDGLPYSAAGLVWRRYGEAAVRAVLGAEAAMAAAIAVSLDRSMVRRIDAIDNGVGEPGDALCLSAVVEDLNPAWDSADSGDRGAEDAAFLAAAGLVEAALRRRIAALRAEAAAVAVVTAAHAGSADPRILELDRKLPWEDAAHAAGLPVLYAVYPVPNGNWMVDAMPAEPGAFAQRLPLPAAWAGLRDEALAAVSGVPDAVFVHARQFVGAARSREGAMAMARRAIALA